MLCRNLMSTAGEILSVLEIKVSLLELWFYFYSESSKNRNCKCRSIQQGRYFVFLRYFPFMKILSNESTSKLLWFVQLLKLNQNVHATTLHYFTNKIEFLYVTAGKILNALEIKVNSFELWFHFWWESSKNYNCKYSSFQQGQCFVFLRYFPFMKILSNGSISKLLGFVQLLKLNQNANLRSTFSLDKSNFCKLLWTFGETAKSVNLLLQHLQNLFFPYESLLLVSYRFIFQFFSNVSVNNVEGVFYIMSRTLYKKDWLLLTFLL